MAREIVLHCMDLLKMPRLTYLNYDCFGDDKRLLLIEANYQQFTEAYQSLAST